MVFFSDSDSTNYGPNKLVQDNESLFSIGSQFMKDFYVDNGDSTPASEHVAEVKALDLAFKDVTLERALGIHSIRHFQTLCLLTK